MIKKWGAGRVASESIGTQFFLSTSKFVLAQVLLHLLSWHLSRISEEIYFSKKLKTVGYAR